MRRVIASGYTVVVRRCVHNAFTGMPTARALIDQVRAVKDNATLQRKQCPAKQRSRATPLQSIGGASSRVLKVEMPGACAAQVKRFFATYGEVDVRQLRRDTMLVCFDDAESAALALKLSSPMLKVQHGAWDEYSRCPVSSGGISPITFSDAFEWCKARGAWATVELERAYRTNETPASEATPIDYFCFNSVGVVDQLFPRGGNEKLVELLRRDVRIIEEKGEAERCMVPVRSVYWAMVADMEDWAPLQGIADVWKRRECVVRRLELTFGLNDGELVAPFLGPNNEYLLILTVGRYLQQRRLDKPLVEVMDEVIEQPPLTKIPQSSYTSNQEWLKVLPPYWVSPNVWPLQKRGGYPVFDKLIQTEEVIDVMKTDVTAQMLLIGGESGAGKTCALLSAGAGHASRATHHLHLVATGSAVFPTGGTLRTSEEVLQRVRNYVHGLLERPLAMTSGNADHVLRVVLYIDEAGANFVQGQLSESDIGFYMRELIRGFKALQKATSMGKGDTAVKLSITVVAAGTGLETMYGSEGGSIGGLYKKVLLRRPSESSVTAIVTNTLGSDLAGEFLAPLGVSVIACSNLRFLAFTLNVLKKNMDSQRHVDDNNNPLLQRFKKECGGTESGGVKARSESMLLRRLLPRACDEATELFISANGLKDLSPITRELLLRAAHVAYLKRAVLLHDDDDAIDDGLKKAGFTPVRCSDQSKEVSALRTAWAAGIFTTTAVEGALNSEHVCAGAVRQGRGRDGPTSVMVPKNQAPIVMSAMYRVLARGAFPCELTPEGFESLMTVMLCEGLDALAVHEGGCTRRTLRAAVCSASPAAVRMLGGTPKHADDETVQFAHAVHVRLTFKLGMGKDTAASIRRECATALEEHLRTCVDTLHRLGRRIPRALSNRLQQLQKDIKELDKREDDTLPESMHHVMFVLTPLPQSPSPDTVVLCAAGPDKGYLATDQYKRIDRPLSGGDIVEELAKSGVAATVPPYGAPKKVAKSLRTALEALAGVELCETFIGVYKGLEHYTEEADKSDTPIYVYEHDSLNTLGYKPYMSSPVLK